jgi:hypothetical protein
LVGNKSDLEASREVTKDKAEQFCQEYGMDMLETSAKSGDNVLQAFEKLIGIVMSFKPLRNSLELFMIEHWRLPKTRRESRGSVEIPEVLIRLSSWKNKVVLGVRLRMQKLVDVRLVNNILYILHIAYTYIIIAYLVLLIYHSLV